MNINGLKSRIGIRPRRVFYNSFLDFWANLFNISGNLYEYEYRKRRGGLEQDAQRLAQDWQAVGQDIQRAQDKVKKEIEEKEADNK